jgi:hypothetical protein
MKSIEVAVTPRGRARHARRGGSRRVCALRHFARTRSPSSASTARGRRSGWPSRYQPTRARGGGSPMQTISPRWAALSITSASAGELEREVVACRAADSGRSAGPPFVAARDRISAPRRGWHERSRCTASRVTAQQLDLWLVESKPSRSHDDADSDDLARMRTPGSERATAGGGQRGGQTPGEPDPPRPRRPTATGVTERSGRRGHVSVTTMSTAHGEGSASPGLHGTAHDDGTPRGL